MRRARDWIGLPVFTRKNGRRIGEVSDILFKDDERAYALLVQRGGVFLQPLALLLEDVLSLGRDAVIVRDESALRVFERLDPYRCLLETDSCFVGKTLMREDGVELGTVADVYIANDEDKIVGYEVTDGLLTDWLHGRKRIPFEATLHIGEVILVRAGVPMQKV